MVFYGFVKHIFVTLRLCVKRTLAHEILYLKPMKNAIIITIMLSCIRINAQTLTCIVCDKDTKQPVSGAYVSLEGTSITVITENTGSFTLTVSQMNNTKLVLSHLAYQALIIESPFNNLPDTIYMEKHVNTLN